MEHPFFSVIIPTYNRRHFLKIAMESVLGQDFTDFELIVVDDGSTDGTKEMIQDYLGGRGQGEGGRVKYFSQENKGPAAARNRGVRESQGEYLCFLDSDDRFMRFKLSVTAEYIRRFPDLRVFHTEEIWYRDGKYLEPKGEHRKPEGWCFEQALRLCCVSPSTVVVHRSVFDTVGFFDESFLSCEDYEFWLRVLHRFPIKLIPQFLTIKDGGRRDQQSQKYFGMDRFRFAAIEKIIPRLSGDQRRAALQMLIEKGTIYYQGAIKRKKTDESLRYQDVIRRAREEIGNCD